MPSRTLAWPLARRHLTDAERNAALERALAATTPADRLLLEGIQKRGVKATRNLGTVSMRELLSVVGVYLVEHPELIPEAQL